jgi:hypothetical protein
LQEAKTVTPLQDFLEDLVVDFLGNRVVDFRGNLVVDLLVNLVVDFLGCFFCGLCHRFVSSLLCCFFGGLCCRLGRPLVSLLFRSLTSFFFCKSHNELLSVVRKDPGVRFLVFVSQARHLCLRRDALPCLRRTASTGERLNQVTAHAMILSQVASAMVGNSLAVPGIPTDQGGGKRRAGMAPFPLGRPPRPWKWPVARFLARAPSEAGQRAERQLG